MSIDSLSIGAEPPPDGDQEAWMEASMKNPQPISAHYMPIYMLLRDKYFHKYRGEIDYHSIRDMMEKKTGVIDMHSYGFL